MAKLMVTEKIEKIIDRNVIERGENAWRHDSTLVLLELMTLKTELVLKGFKMQKSSKEGWYSIGPINNDWKLECNWEFLLLEPNVDSIIDTLKRLRNNYAPPNEG
jgi:hypothetical protein